MCDPTELDHAGDQGCNEAEVNEGDKDGRVLSPVIGQQSKDGPDGS